VGGRGATDGPGRVKPRPGGPKQDVEGRRAKPTAPGNINRQEDDMDKLVQFVKESYAELRKVIWPSRADVVSSVKIVIISTVLIAAVLGLVDVLLLLGVQTIFR
jgi:preprotein translocase subunit SecE